jgi:hypothetical protein
MSQLLETNLPVRLSFQSPPVRWEFAVTPPCSEIEKHFHMKGEAAFYSYVLDKDDISRWMTIDPWELRIEFLRLQYHDSVEKFLKFLRRAGEFGSTGNIQMPATGVFASALPEPVLINGERRHYRDVITVRMLIAYQDALRYALENKQAFYGCEAPIYPNQLDSPAQKLDFNFSVTLSADGKPYLLAQPYGFWESAMLSVHKDYLEGAEIKKCERHDCGVQYPAIGGYERKYCSPYCGHLEYMRKKRKEQRWQKQEMESIAGKIAQATGSRGKTPKAEGEGARRELKHSRKRRTRAAQS